MSLLHFYCPVFFYDFTMHIANPYNRMIIFSMVYLLPLDKIGFEKTLWVEMDLIWEPKQKIMYLTLKTKGKFNKTKGTEG